MAMIRGTIFAFVILLVILFILVDVNTGMSREVSRFTFAYVALLAGAGLLGFMWITNTGFSNKPKASRYDH